MFTNLAKLKIHDRGQIAQVTATGEIRQRLLEMGLVQGVSFKVLRKAPLGDPIEIRLKGLHLSLRLAEAKTVLVEKVVSGKNPQANPTRGSWRQRIFAGLHRKGKRADAESA